MSKFTCFDFALPKLNETTIRIQYFSMNELRYLLSLLKSLHKSSFIPDSNKLIKEGTLSKTMIHKQFERPSQDTYNCPRRKHNAATTQPWPYPLR
ncbi:hypothetical protein CEXT_803411 [Caerostris extrusa]|uniref:LAGLIDADG homing endonuclease n=1 Tax=Caerostris extrusa TaxID=172846 RepID=A0AAV4T9D5_CAEEX|nr:hypothetical protein CEXT_803411 [Caerostris extrusa]